MDDNDLERVSFLTPLACRLCEGPKRSLKVLRRVGPMNAQVLRSIYYCQECDGQLDSVCR